MVRRLINLVRRAAAVMAAFFSLLAGGGCISEARPGRFVGEEVSRGLPNGWREMNQPLVFIDADEKRWKVEPGFKTNGASIPSIFWPIVGPPIRAPYFKAAVVHDVYCHEELRTGETWQEVHRMLFDACVTADTPPLQAKVIYAAVYLFGPRWQTARLQGLDDRGGAGVDERIAAVLSETLAVRRALGRPGIESLGQTPEERAQASLKYDPVRGLIVAVDEEGRPLELSADELQELLARQQLLMYDIEQWINEENPSLETIRTAPLRAMKVH